MKKLFAFVVFFTACSASQVIEVNPEIVVLVKKSKVYRYPDYRTVQLWQTLDCKITFYEQLPDGDTGVTIGKLKEVFTKR